MTPIDHDDPDIAQATMFLGVLLAEIDTLCGRIDTAERRHGQRTPWIVARDNGGGPTRRSCAPSCTRCTAVVDRLAFRFPAALASASDSLSRGGQT